MNKQSQNKEEKVLSATASSCSIVDSDEELQHMPLMPPIRMKVPRKRLSKQLSMCETQRDLAWEKRRLQMLSLERKKHGIIECGNLTDEDLNELKGCIELGFGFNEEDGQGLCNTLPALDLYFAVNRKFSPSPVSTPQSQASTSSLGERSASFGSPRSEDAWKICSPGI